MYRYVPEAGRRSNTSVQSADTPSRTRTSKGVQGSGAQLAKEAAKTALLRRIHRIAARLGVDPALGEAIARAESGLDQTARSPDGKTEGAFQIKRMTAAEMRKRLKNDPARLPLSDEVTLGIGYLRYLDRLFARRAVLGGTAHSTTPVGDDGERRRFAIAAYNAGEGRVASGQRQAQAAGLDPRRFDDVRPFLPPVTQRYVDRVLAFAVTAAGRL